MLFQLGIDHSSISLISIIYILPLLSGENVVYSIFFALSSLAPVSSPAGKHKSN